LWESWLVAGARTTQKATPAGPGQDPKLEERINWAPIWLTERAIGIDTVTITQASIGMKNDRRRSNHCSQQDFSEFNEQIIKPASLQ
jgi:hypothetical protein